MECAAELLRRLPQTDPYDRQITIGFGAFLELAAIAAAWQAGKSPEDVAEAAIGAGAADHPPGWLVRQL